MNDSYKSACLVLSILACTLLSSCVTSTTKSSSQSVLVFEVRFAHESEGGLRVGNPVRIAGSQVGRVVRVERKFENSIGESRTYAMVHVDATNRLRVEDRIAIRFDDAARENYIEISLKDGDRSKWRPIENGMLMEGEAGSTLTEKVKGASSSLSEKIKGGFENLRKKVQGN
ncbi:MAG: MlaD family protein [Planctomycetota bacterium]|nr:MlaD family protein [Planctomycetota bacterium]